MSQDAASDEENATAAAAADAARLTESAKLCSRLFPEQLVLQTACRTRCVGDTSSDGQACAFSFSRATREVVPERVESHAMAWSFVTAGALLCVACLLAVAALRRHRR